MRSQTGLNGNKKPPRKATKSRSTSESPIAIPEVLSEGHATQGVRGEDFEERLRREERNLRVKKKARSRANSDDEARCFVYLSLVFFTNLF